MTEHFCHAPFKKPGFLDRLIHAEAAAARLPLVTFEKAAARLPDTRLLKSP
jgi:hypothetical protein